MGVSHKQRIFVHEQPAQEPDENTALLSHAIDTSNGDIEAHAVDQVATDQREALSSFAVMSILSVLFVGVFVANMDMTLLLVTYPQISSDLHAFRNGAWLITSYMLAMCATQPLYGKLSNIFGRKRSLVITYLLYALGSGLCALSSSLWHVIIGRVVGGMGGAGMICLVSIIITDIVPLREVAAYRSYVNVVQTIGRSVGAPVGGLIVQTCGWRAVFAMLVPLSVLGAVLVQWRLKITQNSHEDEEETTETVIAQIKRIDFLGAALLSLTIVTTLLVLSLGGDQVPWNSRLISALTSSTLFTGTIFYFVENYYATEPIFPTHLLGIQAVIVSYGTLFCQNAAQSAATFSLPLFYQILLGVGPSAAGTFLLPSVVGNTVGGLIAGVYVKRHGRYRLLCILASVSSIIAYTLMFIRWTPQPDFHPYIEDVYVVGAGVGTGMAHAAAFIVLTAGMSAYVHGKGGTEKDLHDNIAIGGSGIYLCGNVGATVGISLSAAILHLILKSTLARHLNGSELEWATKKALESVDWVQNLEKGSRLRTVVVDAYMDGLHWTFAQAGIFSFVAFFLSLIMFEHKMN